jgi:hypothetical protein
MYIVSFLAKCEKKLMYSAYIMYWYYFL